MQTEKRKLEHIEIVLKKPVQYDLITTGFENYLLDYNCCPDLDLEEVDTEIEFLGKKFSAPIMVDAITGGCKEAEEINKGIAKACQKFGIGFCLGSQRAMLEDKSLWKTYYVRDVAPDIFVAGNIGIVQLKEYTADEIAEALKKIKADALVVHCNAAQEALQKEGTTNFKGSLQHLINFAENFEMPIIVKEVGCGINKEIAKKLAFSKISALNIAGAGGTSWCKVEIFRNPNARDTYAEFGLPTAFLLEQIAEVFPKPIIASGGIRNGLQIVKALALNAKLCAFAYPALKAYADGGVKAVEELLQKIIQEIKIGLFLINAKNCKEAKGRVIKMK